MIDTKFELDQLVIVKLPAKKLNGEVVIPELNTTGKIIQIVINELGITYWIWTKDNSKLILNEDELLKSNPIEC
jgi:hypothetical protein